MMARAVFISRLLPLTALLIGCGESAAPPAVTTVTLSPGTLTIVVGTTATISATTLGPRGQSLTGRPVTWSSDQPTIASVSASGVVSGVAPGSALVRATSEGKAATTSVTVLPVPVASVRVFVPASTVRVGRSLQLAAEARDEVGNILPDRPITWSSSNPALATVSGSGLVAGIGAGSVSITAASEGKSAIVPITVLSPLGAPVIQSIAPDTLVPGESVTITGTGFSTAGYDGVWIGNMRATLIQADSLRVIARVPCVRTGSADVTVSFDSLRATRMHPVVARRRTLAVGQSFIATTAAEAACNELVTTDARARYLVALYSAATSANTLLSVGLHGNPGSATLSRLAPRWSPPAMRPAREPAAEDDAHAAMLERDRALFEQLRVTASPRRPVTFRRIAPPAVGDRRSAWFTFTGGCNDTTRAMRLRAIYVGEKSVIWEDSANTLQSAADSLYAEMFRRLGQAFDREQYETVRRHFADPLLRDAETDGDGRIHMIFTQRLNGTGAAAYVTSCDQFIGQTARGSNFGEYFYGFVPTQSGNNVNSTTFVGGWFNFMGRTVVHEVKHIASIASRVASSAPSLEQSWLEEGTARHAEELWVRQHLHRVAWKGNSGWGTATSNGVYCDFHAEDATCAAADPVGRPSFGMRRHFNEIREKLVEPWNWSPYGTATGQAGSVFYQTAWSMVRYTMDRHAASEEAFLRALTNTQATGTTNLAAVAGVPVDRLLGGWGLSLVVDDLPGLENADPDVRFPTWNLRSIYAGLNASPSWTARWPTPYPVLAQPVALGSFAVSANAIRGGAHAYFELSGPLSGPQMLGLVDASGGGVASPFARLAVVRLP